MFSPWWRGSGEEPRTQLVTCCWCVIASGVYSCKILCRSFSKVQSAPAGYQRTPSTHLINSSFQACALSLQSCVRSRLIKMWPFSTDMWDKFLFDTLVANLVVLSCIVFRSYDERLKPLTLQLLIQIFMTIVGSWLTNSVFFIGIANPFPFTICCTAYSIYSVWNILRDGPEEDFLELILFNVGVAAMVKMSEKLV